MLNWWYIQLPLGSERSRDPVVLRCLLRFIQIKAVHLMLIEQCIIVIVEE